jgi:hypothetical protein
VVLAVGLEVVGQVVDALGKHRHLNLGRPGIIVVGLVFLDQRLLFDRCDRHE